MSIYQLRCLIFPNDQPLLDLKSLDVGALSPLAFNANFLEASGPQMFESLKKLRLSFSLESVSAASRDAHANGVAGPYSMIERGSLKACLAAAKGLESLTIGFDEYGPTAHVKHIFGNNVWPNLVKLDIDCMKGDRDFVDLFKRQPSLKRLSMSFMFLEGVTWIATLPDLKSKLGKSLERFTANGLLLEDQGDFYNTASLDEYAYIDNQEEISLADMLDLYVTGSASSDDNNFNPLTDVAWADPEMLWDRYGDIDELEATRMSGSDDEDEDDEDDTGAESDTGSTGPMELD